MKSFTVSHLYLWDYSWF